MATNLLLSDIEKFIAKHGVKETVFGKKAINDPHLLEDMRDGRRIWPETESRIRKFMATYRTATKARAA